LPLHKRLKNLLRHPVEYTVKSLRTKRPAFAYLDGQTLKEKTSIDRVLMSVGRAEFEIPGLDKTKVK